MTDQVADHLLDQGLAGLRLGDLARRTGVSSRMLLHYFGSKEELVARGLEAARTRQLVAFRARLEPRPPTPYRDVLAAAWSWLGSSEARPYLRLFEQLQAVAREPGSRHAGFAERSVVEWLPVLESGFARDGAGSTRAAELATLTLAVVRGLLLDVSATDDRARADAAFDRFVALLHGPPDPA